ncbi:hypothetical protein MPSEU_000457500 [Mayamaea pseudoterrestris]|nr:hypothetical protein MPSEU_000457500 [Mayamaea pseudoterrestris]
MANVLHASIRQILSDVPVAEETTLIASKLRDEADVTVPRTIRVPMELPVYQLKDDKKIWQLTSVGFEHLSILFPADGGFILQISSNLCALFYDNLRMDGTIQIRDSNGIKYVKIGPLFESYVRIEEERYRFTECQLFLAQTSIPYDRDDLSLIKQHLQDILQLATSYPLSRDVSQNDYSRRLVLHALYNMPVHDAFTPKCLRDCFQQDSWRQRGVILIDQYQLSPREWDGLEEFPFERFKLFKTSVPWRFLQNTRSKTVQVIGNDTDTEGAPGKVSPIQTRLNFRCRHLETLEQVNEFCSMWLSFAGEVEYEDGQITEEAWQHLWQSPVLYEGTSWTSFNFTGVTVGEWQLCQEHLSAIPTDRSFTLEWTAAEDDDSHPSLLVRRRLPALAAGDMAYFQMANNPLLKDDPPTDVRQSLILASLLGARNNPDQQFKLCRAFSNMLLKARTPAGQFEDLEASVIELRALGMDHQATITLMLEVMNAQEMQHAQEMYQLEVRMRALMEEKEEQFMTAQRQSEEEIRRLTQSHSKQEIKMQRIEAKNDSVILLLDKLVGERASVYADEDVQK